MGLFVKLSIVWTVLSLIVVGFLVIHLTVLDSAYASDLAKQVWQEFHGSATDNTTRLSKDAIAIAYQLGRLDFATFALTGLSIIIALAGAASYVGIKTTALETTENKILELLDDPDFEEKIRAKMGDDIHLKVSEAFKQAKEVRDNIENQEVGSEFDAYFDK